MRLIVGLGNPGAEYEWTPHNLGFLAVDGLAERAGIRVTRPESKALVGRGELAGQEVILAKPQTMMNLSGVSVRMLLSAMNAIPAELIVLVDEVDLPWGMLRIREQRPQRHAQRNENRSSARLGRMNSCASGRAFGRKRFGATAGITFLATMGREERQAARADGGGCDRSGRINFERKA